MLYDGVVGFFSDSEKKRSTKIIIRLQHGVMREKSFYESVNNFYRNISQFRTKVIKFSIKTSQSIYCFLGTVFTASETKIFGFLPSECSQRIQKQLEQKWPYFSTVTVWSLPYYGNVGVYENVTGSERVLKSLYRSSLFSCS